MSARQSGVEVRSIDYVPLSERHGELWHLGPLWFMGNAQIATLAVGVVGVEAGGNLFWSLVAILAGVLTGTFFMAFHSAQGPQLGLPQMIQSRPQFGYIGALLVWLFAYVQYAGFNVFNTILAGQAAHRRSTPARSSGSSIATALAVVIALIGYDFIHRVERGADLHVPAHLRRLHDRRDRHARTCPPARSTRRTSTLIAVPHAVRRHRRLPDLAGRSTSRTTRATCRRTSPCARRSGGRTGARASARIWLMGLGALLAAVGRRRRSTPCSRSTPPPTGSSTASARSCCCSPRSA